MRGECAAEVLFWWPHLFSVEPECPSFTATVFECGGGAFSVAKSNVVNAFSDVVSLAEVLFQLPDSFSLGVQHVRRLSGAWCLSVAGVQLLTLMSSTVIW